MNGELHGPLAKARNAILVIGGPFDGVDLYWTADKHFNALDLKPNLYYTVREFQVYGQKVSFLCFNMLDLRLAEDWAKEAIGKYWPNQNGKKRRKH